MYWNSPDFVFYDLYLVNFKILSSNLSTLASFLVKYFISTHYTDSEKSIHFLLLFFTEFVQECQIELGFREIVGSVELNFDISENLFYNFKMMTYCFNIR